MKKITLLMVLALAACGEGKNTPAALVTPSTLEMLHNDPLLNESLATCKKDVELDKKEPSLLCTHAVRADRIRQASHQFGRCGLKHTPEEQKACFDKEYDEKYKE
jgi:hypothetical protein